MDKRLMAQLLTSIGDGVIAVDSAEKIIFMNEAAERITGWESAKAHGQPFDVVFNLYHAQTKKRLASPVAEVRQSGLATGLHDQTVLITKDGAMKYLSASCAPIGPQGKYFSGVVVVFRDISRYKVMEKTIENEKNNLRTILNSAPVGMYIVDESRAIRQINGAALKLLGRNLGEVIGRTFGDAFCCRNSLEKEKGCGYSDSCQYCEFQRAVSLAFEGLAVSGIECSKTIVHNGREVLFWFRASASPIVVDGKPMVMVALVDITDQKQKESSIIKTRDYYLRIFESFPTIIWRINITGEMESINETWQTLTGQTISQAAGHGWLERVHPEDRRKCFDPNYSRINEKGLFEGEIRVLDLSGQYRWLYCVHKLYSNMTGIAEGYIGMGIDITDRKIAEEQLKGARDKAEAVNKAKSEFLANMSHEIRTPINGIMGMIDLTLLTGLNTEQKENLATAKSCARSLLGIINDILDFSKMEAGKLLLQSHNFKLRTLLDEVIKAHSHRAKRKGLDLDYTFSTAIPEILSGDSNRLRQVLNNLIDNAIKFTEHGGVALAIKASEAGKGSVEIVFVVRDTGIGIAPHEMDKLFKTFSQVDGSTTRRYGGTGLGLVISKQLVEMMGGKMWVESEKDLGSTFYFTIPFQIGRELQDSQQKKKNAATAKSPMNLLLVEDDPLNRIVIQRQLITAGHAVDLAENGVVALELWRKKKYDAILMDIQMPEMDGIEATKKIREAEADTKAHIPILALTAHALVGDRERFLAAGMDEYMAKPVQMEDLSEMLESFSPRKQSYRLATSGSVQLNESGDIVIAPSTTNSLSADLPVLVDIESLAASIADEVPSDMELIEGIAHKIKGLANKIGSDEMKSVAFKAELAARRGNQEEALEHICHIRRMSEAFKKNGFIS